MADVVAPRDDAEVPAFWQALGVAGGVDLHVHFMPERMQQKVWRFFDAVLDPDGQPRWPIHYRWPAERRLERLRALGVLAWPSLVYAHKPGMAEWLCDWAGEFAATVPECVRTATFYPEPGVDRYVARALEAGACIWKVHVQVGRFDLADPRLTPVWRRLEAAGAPVVIHTGSGPEPGPYTGPAGLRAVMEAHPELVAVVAHMGMHEYREFLELVLRYPNAHLDVTMAFTDFVEAEAPYPRELLDVLAEHPGRVVLGSDFPTIPHSYAHQLQALVRLGLGRDWLRAVCHDNGARLLGLER